MAGLLWIGHAEASKGSCADSRPGASTFREAQELDTPHSAVVVATPTVLGIRAAAGRAGPPRPSCERKTEALQSVV